MRPAALRFGYSVVRIIAERTSGKARSPGQIPGCCWIAYYTRAAGGVKRLLKKAGVVGLWGSGVVGFTTSPPRHLATSPPRHLATSPPRHLRSRSDVRERNRETGSA